ERELKVGAVILTGADLDSQLFVRGDHAGAARAALDRAELWWFTVPDPGRCDRVLQVRKMDVGRPAIGNSGPLLSPEDAARLLRERRLVIDIGRVPPAHWFGSYYRDRRVTDVAAAINHLTFERGAVMQSVAGEREVLAGDTMRALQTPAADLLT